MTSDFYVPYNTQRLAIKV